MEKEVVKELSEKYNKRENFIQLLYEIIKEEKHSYNIRKEDFMENFVKSLD